MVVSPGHFPDKTGPGPGAPRWGDVERRGGRAVVWEEPVGPGGGSEG